MIPVPRIELNAATLKLILGIACALALALLIHDRNRWKAAAAERQDRLVAERAAHAGTIAQYRAAADRARAVDRANAERVKAEQAAINERTANDYQKRLAAARAAAGRLRGQAAAAGVDSGARRAAPMPRISAAAGGIAEGPGEDGFSLSGRRCEPEGGYLGLDDALIATEQAIQLDELIKWVRDQAGIDLTRETPVPPGAPRRTR